MRLITVFMPDIYVSALDKLVREHKYASRAEAIRTAIKQFLTVEGALFE